MKVRMCRILVSTVALIATAFATAASAQDVVDERTETIPVTITPIGPGTTSGGMGVTVMRSGTGFGGNTVMQETQVTVLAFQIPDFNPDDLLTHVYHVGMFSATGNGSGTVYPNDSGYAEFDMRRGPGENPMQTFLYSVHVDTGEVRAFIDVDDVTVNQAAQILTNLALNSRLRPGPGRVPFSGPLFGPGRAPPVPPLAIGDEYRVALVGDYLTVEDLQEQIFAQTRCNVDERDGRYRVLSCD